MSFRYLYGFHDEDGHKLLIQLINQKDMEALKSALENRDCHEITDAHLYHALNKCVLDQNSELVDMLIQNGAPVMESLIVTKSKVKSLDELDCSPMLAALFSDSPDIMSTLISHGASVNLTYKEIKDRTLVMQAVIWDKPECLEVLVNHGADIHNTCVGARPNASGFRRSCRSSDMWSDRRRIMRMFSGDHVGRQTSDTRRIIFEETTDDEDDLEELQQHFGYRVIHGFIQTPTMAAACLGHCEVLQILLKHGGDFNETDAIRMTPLLHAAAGGHTSCLEALIQAGGDITATNRKNESALFKAALGGHADCVKLILQTHSSQEYLNATSHAGTTLCEAAVEGGSVEVLKALVEKGVPLPQKNGNPLLTALEKDCSTNMLEYMIFRGANVNGTDELGVSPLIKAVQCKNIEAIETLLEFGADINHQTKEGNTALMNSVRKWCPEIMQIIELLINRGSDINLINKRGRNVLMFAVSLDVASYMINPFTQITIRRKLVSMFLEKGISVGLCDVYGSYVFDIARQENGYQDEELLRLLYVAGGSASQRPPRALNISQPPAGLNSVPEGEVPLLQHVCRDVIRDHLVLNNVHSNLFKIVPKLHLPAPVLSFLLYEMEIENENGDDYGQEDCYEGNY